MSTKVNLYAVESRYTKLESPDTTFTGRRSSADKSVNDCSFLKIEAPAEEYRQKAVLAITLHVYCYNNTGDATLEARAGNAEYKSDITYNTQDLPTIELKTPSILSSGWWTFTAAYPQLVYPNRYAQMLREGIGLSFYLRPVTKSLNNSGFDLVGSSHVPYAEVTFSDADAFLRLNSVSPSSGAYVPKFLDNTFTWGFDRNGYAIDDVTVTASKFRWKSSASGAATEIDCGTDLSCTIPANTFSTDTVMWQAEITDSTGYTSTSEWQTLTTVEVTPDAAIALTPKNTMEDGSQPITFTWQHVISTGTEQSEAQIQRSTNGTTWTNVVTISGDSQSTNIGAGTFHAGQNYWRVRTANTDSTYGAWSDATPFLVVSAPPKPNVSTDGKARPTVSWQSTDQQGYRVKIDDLYDSGVMYGTATSIVVPMYLSDGNYTVKVSVVNSYELWSEYGTAPLNVAATSTGTVTLTAESGSDVSLTWTATEYSDGMFIVYRDGNQIAVTSEKAYVDTLTAGEHVYTVRQIRASDYNATALSNAVEAAAHVETLTIIDTDTGDQMRLQYSSTQYRDEMETKSMDMTLFHFSGAEYPVPEISSFTDKIISFRTAFMDLGEAAEFEGFYKKTVCVKTPKDNVVVGVFSSFTKTESRFFVGYDFAIQQINFSEVVTL